jgi:phosphatidylglycerophosphatase A
MKDEAMVKKAVSDKMVLMVATGFGLGYSPVASGTAGTLPGLLIALLLNDLHWGWQVALCLLLTVVAVPVCDRAEKIFGGKDDGRIVADEYMTFPICVIGLSLMSSVWLLPAAFVVARFTDIVKFPPAAQSQKIKGGLGIVLDDAIANVYALLLLRLALHFVPALGG